MRSTRARAPVARLLLSAVLLRSASGESAPACDAPLAAADELPLADGALESHWLLIPEACGLEAAAAYDRELSTRRVALATGELAALLNLTGADCPAAACLERGLQPSLFAAGATRSPAVESAVALARWIVGSCDTLDVGFINLLGRDMEIHRENRVPTPLRSSSRDNGVQKYRDEVYVKWALGTKYELRELNGTLIRTGQVAHAGADLVGIDEYPPFDPSDFPKREWWHLTEANRLLEVERATRIQHRYTHNGSQLMRAPDEIWASVAAFYHNNRNNWMREEWNPDTVRPFVNFWEVPFYVIPLPPNLKARWHAALRPLVEEWAGGVPLEMTDLYGMRVYTRGSWLIPHVDREDTHALSLVFNVAQGVVDTPWPLEVDTMGDGVARAKLSPGDFTFYESARCLHGRSSPFDGDFFVNLFAHFRPRNEPKWHETEEVRRANDAAAKLPPNKAREGARRLSFVLRNAHPDRVLYFYWLPPSRTPSFEPSGRHIEPGEQRSLNSFDGHRFAVLGACTASFAVSASVERVTACGDPGESRSENAEWIVPSAPLAFEPPEAGRTALASSAALVAPHILADAYAKLGVESVGESVEEPPEPTAAERPRRYVEFVNEGEEPVEVFWTHPRTGEEAHVSSIPGNARQRIQTFSGHTFQVRGACEMRVTIDDGGYEDAVTLCATGEAARE